ncbi:MAG: hypothetical protein JZU49_00195 [Sulfuricurvum sp.]|nr:hypothetical protein [Sulfuricurvum sp.]
MKTFVLTVSTKFPKTHKRAGEETYFPFEIVTKNKLHTIRSNYELWKKRIEQIQKGEAILSIRYWSGKPYNSKQIEFYQLDKDSGIGVQKLELSFNEKPCYVYNSPYGVGWYRFVDEKINILAENDGLSIEDFKEWFKGYDLSKPMAIIHFTPMRY